MKKLHLNFRYGFINILLFFLILFSCLLGENADFFQGYYDSRFTLNSAITLFVILILVFAIYFFIEFKKNKGHKNKFIFIFLTLFFGLGIFSIWKMGTHELIGKSTTVIFNQSIDNRIIYTFSLIISYLLMLSLLIVLPSRKGGLKITRLLSYGIILTGIIAICFSFYKDFAFYKELFSGNSIKQYLGITSFFNNKNVFGFCLMAGIFATVTLSFKKMHWWYYLIIFIFFIFMVLTTSSTSCLASLLFILLFLLYRFIRTIKAHTKRNLIILSVLILIIVGGAITFSLLVKYNVSPFPSISSFIIEQFFSKDFSSLTGRIPYWQSILNLLSPEEMAIGCGYKNFNDLIDAYLFSNGQIPMHSADSVYVQIIGSYGVIGLILYSLYIIYLFYISFYLIKKKKTDIGMISLILLFSLSVYGIAENCTLAGISMKGLSVSVTFLPILISEYQSINKAKVESVYEKVDDSFINVSPISYFLNLSLSGALVIVSSLFIFPSIRSQKMSGILIAISALCLGILLIPYIVNVIHKKNSNKNYVINYFEFLYFSFRPIIIPLLILIGSIVCINFILLILYASSCLTFMSLFSILAFIYIIFITFSNKIVNTKTLKKESLEYKRDLNNSIIKPYL